jgi:hypothetical protein
MRIGLFIDGTSAKSFIAGIPFSFSLTVCQQEETKGFNLFPFSICLLRQLFNSNFLVTSNGLLLEGVKSTSLQLILARNCFI